MALTAEQLARMAVLLKENPELAKQLNLTPAPVAKDPLQELLEILGTGNPPAPTADPKGNQGGNDSEAIKALEAKLAQAKLVNSAHQEKDAALQAVALQKIEAQRKQASEGKSAKILELEKQLEEVRTKNAGFESKQQEAIEAIVTSNKTRMEGMDEAKLASLNAIADPKQRQDLLNVFAPQQQGQQQQQKVNFQGNQNRDNGGNALFNALQGLAGRQGQQQNKIHWKQDVNNAITEAQGK